MIPPDDNDEPIPARMLNELVYCPRLFYLEHVDGEWADNVETLQGNRVHRRVDAGQGALPPAEELAGEQTTTRSVTVTSIEAGIVAKTDIIEVADGTVVPVDYKRGAAPDPEHVADGAWPADRVQIGAQALALIDNGYWCAEGALYYARSKTRVRVPITPALLDEVRSAVAEAHRVRRLPVAPPPLVASPKCPRCSLVGICLPDEVRSLSDAEECDDAPDGTVDEEDATPEAKEEGANKRASREAVRKLLPARDDQRAVYVQAHGARVGRDKECLSVTYRDGTSTSVRTREVSQLNVLGNVQLTAAAIQELCQRGIPVGLFSYGGWFYGTVQGFTEKNVLLRIAQFEWAADAGRRLGIAREIVAGKIANCRTLLRRNAGEPVAGALAALKRIGHEALGAASEAELLGIEGNAARVYFEQFGKLLAPRSGKAGAFDFTVRNRRPPKDPVNALLSLGYAMLAKDMKIALGMAGFDPTVGFYHRPRHGRPALALDLMEEFRPLVVDSTVITVVNTEVMRPDHFVYAAGGCALNDDGRRAFIAAYERRMDHEVTHPLFGYTVSYRRILEVQARLLGRVVTGELSRYPGFRTR